jgi:hypothetical protein
MLILFWMLFFIDPVWQSSVEKYNKLKLSKFFIDCLTIINFVNIRIGCFYSRMNFCGVTKDTIISPWFVGYDKPTEEF